MKWSPYWVKRHLGFLSTNKKKRNEVICYIGFMIWLCIYTVQSIITCNTFCDILSIKCIILILISCVHLAEKLLNLSQGKENACLVWIVHEIMYEHTWWAFSHKRLIWDYLPMFCFCKHHLPPEQNRSSSLILMSLSNFGSLQLQQSVLTSAPFDSARCPVHNDSCYVSEL